MESLYWSGYYTRLPTHFDSYGTIGLLCITKCLLLEWTRPLKSSGQRNEGRLPHLVVVESLVCLTICGKGQHRTTLLLENGYGPLYGRFLSNRRQTRLEVYVPLPVSTPRDVYTVTEVVLLAPRGPLLVRRV